MWIKVAVPVPALGLLTYAVPDGQPAPTVGARAVVPLGPRTLTGVIVHTILSHDAIDDAIQAEAIRPVRAILDAEPFVPADVIALAQWTADYYAAGLGDTITAVLPPMARGERADAHKMRRIARITAAGLDAVPADAEPADRSASDGAARTVTVLEVTARQREALQLLAASPGGAATSVLAARGVSPDLLARLVRRGLVTIHRDRIERDPFESGSPMGTAIDESRRLTLEQQDALERLTAMSDTRQFGVALLHGVTGSGKTELYLRIAAHVRQRGGRVLLLVPEIALTPAVAALFRQAFGERLAIQHSGLSAGERHDQWQRIRRGEVDVVIGTRSAVFAPIGQLALIIVDEEHDAAYKQEESPRYNGRDVAIVRAQRCQALVVLGSATPSMETYHNAMGGRYERIVLERRVLDRPLAAVTVVDMREEYADAGPDVVLSRALKERLQARFAAREQALVLLNRRGFATAVFCRQCGGTVDCPNCSVSLVVHGEGTVRRSRCHYCNYSARVPTRCPLCAGPYLEQTGFGTERVEAEIKAACPDARVGRLDRDAIRRRGSLTSILNAFRAGAIDVLVGTQMIAKGHDFPRVTLVGVISADVGLGMADFRASERTFQLLTQVAGRAGRGEQAGEALVQTIYPEHYSIQLACSQEYRAFYERELHFRKSMRYPPHVSLINAIVRGRTFARAMDDASRVVELLQQGAASGRDLRVLGPAPAPLGRLRGEYRVQFLLKGNQRRRMRELLLQALAAHPDIQRRTVVDVDPLSVT